MASAIRRCAVLCNLAAIVLLLAATVARADTQDVTSQFSISRSGLVFNRATGTFDSSVTVKNTSGAPVLGRIDSIVSGLPSSVTLANKVGQTPEGKPYVVPLATGAQLANGATLSFVLKFANPQNVAFTTAIQMLYTVVVPAGAPTLISAVPSWWGASTARRTGRSPCRHRPHLPASSARSCRARRPERRRASRRTRSVSSRCRSRASRPAATSRCG